MNIKNVKENKKLKYFKSIKTGNINSWTNVLVLLIIAYTIWTALKLPIYPDEVAYKIFIERFFYSGGYKQSLTPYCEAGFLVKPPLVLLPASIFGSLLILLGGDWWSYRVIPLICISTLVLLLIYNGHIHNKRIPWTFLLVLAITPCIYGLVILRPEILILLGGLIFFLLTYALLEKKLKIMKLFVTSLLIIFIYSFLAFIHPKSLYLLPIVLLYYIYSANSIDKISLKIVYLVFYILLLVLVTTSSIELHKAQFLSCNEVDKIQNAINRQSINPLLLITSPLEFLNGAHQIFKFDLLVRSISQFTFKNNFDSNYLPSIDDNNLLILLINCLNVSIFIIIFIGVLLLSIIVYKFISLKRYLIFLSLSLSYFTPYFLNLNKNWYENSFLLGSVVIMASLFYSNIDFNNINYHLKNKINIFFKYLKIIILLSAIGTVIITEFEINYKFNNGFSGPGISIFLNRNSLDKTINYLIISNDLGEQYGYIVDDLTYDSLKKAKIILPATYLSLVGEWPEIVKNSISHQKVSYGITRCFTITQVNPELQWLVLDKIRDHDSNQEICLFKTHY